MSSLEKSYQDHDSGYSGSSPNVDYRYDTTAVNSVLKDGARVDRITYPSGKYVNIFYGTGDSIADRLHRVDRLQGNHSGTLTDLSTYQHTGAGRVVETDYPVPDVHSRFDEADGDGTYEHLDRFGRVATKDWSTSSTVKDQFTYTYDYVGNRLSRDIPSSLYSTDDKDQLYAYDGLHRLTTSDEGMLNYTGTIMSGDVAFREEWTLDALGNWEEAKQDDDGSGSWDILDQDRTHNDANELTQIDASATHVAHDAAGNMTTIPQPGSWSTDYDLVYDAWNRLVEVNDGETSIAEFQYDGLHRRITKEDVANTDTYHYYYSSSWQVLEVRLDSETGTSIEQNVWHPYYVDALAVRYYDPDNGDYAGADEILYATHDANFNVTSLVNTSGSVKERYGYSAYGDLRIMDGSFGNRSSSSYDNPYTYTGRRFDDETGLYYYRHRYYHAQLGKFVTRDPIGYYGSRWNLYEYANSRPLVFYDPSGLDWLSAYGNWFDSTLGSGWSNWAGGKIYENTPDSLKDDLADLSTAEAVGITTAVSTPIAIGLVAGGEFVLGGGALAAEVELTTVAVATHPATIPVTVAVAETAAGVEGPGTGVGDLADDGFRAGRDIVEEMADSHVADDVVEGVTGAGEACRKLWRGAPDRIADPANEVAHGFHPLDYQSDGLIEAGPYFGLDDAGRRIAEDYAFQYGNGLQEISMRSEVFDDLVRCGVLDFDSNPGLPHGGTSMFAPTETLDQFNEAIQLGPENAFHPEGFVR